MTLSDVNTEPLKNETISQIEDLSLEDSVISIREEIDNLVPKG